MAAAIGASMRGARRPPGPRAGARRGARPALGPRRRVHRRGPVPRRHDRHRLRAGPAVGRACTPRSSTSSATPARGPAATSLPCTPGPRELADVLLPPVRDGDPRRRRPLGHALVRRNRRRARRRRRRPAHRPAARHAGASTASSSPTTSASRSCSCCTAWPRDRGEAAALALDGRRRHRTADRGRLPGSRWPTAVRAGAVDEALVDRAVLRVLAQKAGARAARRDAFEDEPPARGRPRLARATGRSPRRLAEESVVLLAQRRRAAAGRAAATARGHRPERRPGRGALRAATRSRTTCSPQHPACPSASRSRPCSRRSAPSSRAGRGRRVAPRLRVDGDDDPVSRTRSRPRAAADVARPGRRRPGRPVRPRHGRRGQRPRRPRAARRPAASSSRRSSRPARPSCSSCSPAGRTRSAGRSRRGAPAAVLQAFFPGEEGGRRDRGRPLRRGQPVRSAAGLPAALGGCAAVLVPASDPRRPVRCDDLIQHAGAAVRLRAVVHRFAYSDLPCRRGRATGEA